MQRRKPSSIRGVALLTEGVDRNANYKEKVWEGKVALLTEGVDRNDF